MKKANLVALLAEALLNKKNGNNDTDIAGGDMRLPFLFVEQAEQRTPCRVLSDDGELLERKNGCH